MNRHGQVTVPRMPPDLNIVNQSKRTPSATFQSGDAQPQAGHLTRPVPGLS